MAAALAGHSLLAAQPGVDARRIGATGISWGGVTVCILAGVDVRLKPEEIRVVAVVEAGVAGP
jgi:dienelactone hydrolase